MADPILPRGIRAQVILQGKSLLPEDRYVTTWAFQSALSPATEADEVMVQEDLLEFFNVPASPSTASVGSFFSSAIERVKSEIRTYQMGQAPPREVSIRPFELLGGGGAGLPEEVALCLSFYSARNIKRQRGRVFLGPIRQSENVQPAPTMASRPGGNMIEAIRDAARRLEKKASPRPEWCILSRAAGLLYPVTAGWIDDTWDTQRRRGASQNVRTVF